MNNNPNQPEESMPAKKNNKKLILGIVAVLLAVAVVAVVMLYPKPEPPTPTEPTVETTEPPTEAPTELVMLDNMAELYAQNPEIVGWIRIDDTKLDYPVMQTPDDEQKYDRLNFEGKLDLAGLPYIKAACSVDPLDESQNWIIYGHNMKNGTAFKTVILYKDQKFWEEHPTIYYSTLYEERTYEVIAAFEDRIYMKADTCFKYYQFIDPETEEDFNTGLAYFKEKSLYDIEATAEYGDHLITLVTCAYHTKNGRFVVVAREITEPVEESVAG